MKEKRTRVNPEIEGCDTTSCFFPPSLTDHSHSHSHPPSETQAERMPNISMTLPVSVRLGNNRGVYLVCGSYYESGTSAYAGVWD
jgi:hypothetical protein